MKKIAILLAIVTCACFLYAGIGFDVSYYIPSDPNSGVMWNLDFIKVVDEKVDLNFSTSLFLRDSSYGNRTSSGSGHSSGNSAIASEVVSTGYMPFMIGFRAKIADYNGIIPFAGGGIGWGFSWDSVDTISSGSDTRFFSGLAWQLNAGATYPFGSSSELYGKVFWNGSDWTGSKDKDASVFTWHTLDMSGLGIGLGIRLKY